MTESNALRILFLASDPSNLSRLRVGQELRDIREKLQLSQHRAEFLLDSRDSVRPSDLTQAIFDFRPQLIHFSGHGSEDGSICLESLEGTVKPVSPAALAALFKLVSTQVKCVILNACYSDTQASAIAEHIPFVIGMKKAIGDKAAIAFSSGFYKALGAAHPIERAYQFGCVEMRLNGIEEHTTPVLYASATKELGIEKSLHSNHSKLDRLLSAKQWKEADQETAFLMLKICDRINERVLTIEDLSRFPCRELLTINRLWLTYSDQKFGFSVQDCIWQSIGGDLNPKYNTWCQFGDRVGWRKDGDWIDPHSNLDSSISGLLPWAWGNHVVGVTVGQSWWIFSRLRSCS